MFSAATFSSRYFRRLVPGMGTMSSPWASTQPKASCAGVHFFRMANASIRSTNFRLRSKFSSWNRGEFRRQSPGGRSSAFLIFAVRKPRPSGL